MSELVRPRWLVAVQTGTANPLTIQIKENAYFYTLVKPGLNTLLPYTVGGHIGDNSLFISSDVPDNFRTYILKHEIYHDTIFAGVPQEEACVEVVKLELKEAKEALGDRFDLYLYGKQESEGFAGRIEFFKALVEFYKDPKEAAERGPAFVEGINKAYMYLSSLSH